MLNNKADSSTEKLDLLIVQVYENIKLNICNKKFRAIFTLINCSLIPFYLRQNAGVNNNKTVKISKRPAIIATTNIHFAGVPIW